MSQFIASQQFVYINGVSTWNTWDDNIALTYTGIGGVTRRSHTICPTLMSVPPPSWHYDMHKLLCDTEEDKLDYTLSTWGCWWGYDWRIMQNGCVYLNSTLFRNVSFFESTIKRVILNLYQVSVQFKHTSVIIYFFARSAPLSDTHAELECVQLCVFIHEGKHPTQTCI